MDGAAHGEDFDAGLRAYKVNSLTNLDTANAVDGVVVWDAPRSIWNASMLAGALILGPIFFAWDAVAVFLALSAITLCIGHSVGFHRRLIHRSFACPKWLERVLVWFGIAVGMGAPCGPFGCTIPATGRNGRPIVIRFCVTKSRCGAMGCSIFMAV